MDLKYDMKDSSSYMYQIVFSFRHEKYVIGTKLPNKYLPYNRPRME